MSKNFNVSWGKFLTENSRPEKVPFKDTRIRIKLENKEKSLKEVTEDEFEHIQRAIDELGPEDLAFNDIFEGKNRLIIDFPTADETSELGIFVNMWNLMGYEVNWAKGIISSERPLRDTSPSAIAQSLTAGSGATAPVKLRKITLKIGKWLKLLHRYLVKKQKLDVKIQKDIHDTHGRNTGYSGHDIAEVLGEDGAADYYRTKDRIDMLSRYTAHGHGDIFMGAYPGVNSADKVLQLMRYWQNHAAYIKENTDDMTSDRYSIIITRDPVDVWRMSDFDDIESCHSPPSRGGGGEYYKCAVAEAHGHGAVAYVVKTEELLESTGSETIEDAEQYIEEYDGEIFADDVRGSHIGLSMELLPISRLRLRQVRYGWTSQGMATSGTYNPLAGTQLAVPEKRIYGTSIPGFYDRILKWVKEHQETQMKNAPRDKDNKLVLSDFIQFGGSHGDNTMYALIPSLFGISKDDLSGSIKQDTSTEDQLDVNLVAGLQARYQREVNATDEEFNNMMAATEVDGTVEDDYGGGVYITCKATLKITWDEDDWTKMPGVETIEYALSELKEYGLGWVKSDYPYTITKLRGDRGLGPTIFWLLRIDVLTEGLSGFAGQEYAYDPETYHDFCHTVDQEVDNKRETVKIILTNFFKREGYMEGGAIMELGRKVVNEDTGLYHWEAVAEEGYEMDEYEFIQFTAHPEVWYKDLGATEDQAMKIMNDRNFWLEIRKRMAAPAFENTGALMYPQMPLDMDMFGTDGTEGESQELNLYFSVHDDAPNEQVKVLEELVNLWDDQDEINRVASEVFSDMLSSPAKSDGDQIPRSPYISPTGRNIREELNVLKVERMLTRING